MPKHSPGACSPALSDTLKAYDLHTLPDRAREALEAREHMPKNERDRFDTARHEAAHLVAAWAMGATVGAVCINQSDSPRRLPMGKVKADCDLQREEAFIACAGIAWEDIYGNVLHASSDVTVAKAQMAEVGEDLEFILPFTRDFIASADSLINQLAVALYSWAQSNNSGRVAPSKLRRLKAWAVPQIPTFQDHATGNRAVAALPHSPLAQQPNQNFSFEKIDTELDKMFAQLDEMFARGSN